MVIIHELLHMVMFDIHILCGCPSWVAQVFIMLYLGEETISHTKGFIVQE